jgi:hypothetical protein
MAVPLSSSVNILLFSYMVNTSLFFVIQVAALKKQAPLKRIFLIVPKFLARGKGMLHPRASGVLFHVAFRFK